MAETDPTILDEIPDSFWKLIALAKRDEDAYRAKLEKMKQDELVRFYHTFESAAALLKWEPYVDHLDPKLSEDGVDDVARWVVEQGKEYYTRVVNDPEKLPSGPKTPAGYGGEVVDVYYERFDDEIPTQDEVEEE
jgi:hypothetical protein